MLMLGEAMSILARQHHGAIGVLAVASRESAAVFCRVRLEGYC